jgi:hypothetical protein
MATLGLSGGGSFRPTSGRLALPGDLAWDRVNELTQPSPHRIGLRGLAPSPVSAGLSALGLASWSPTQSTLWLRQLLTSSINAETFRLQRPSRRLPGRRPGGSFQAAGETTRPQYKRGLIVHQRYADAKQFKRANQALTTIRTYLRRVCRDLVRKTSDDAELHVIFAHRCRWPLPCASNASISADAKSTACTRPRWNASAREDASTQRVQRQGFAHHDLASLKTRPVYRPCEGPAGNPYDGHTFKTFARNRGPDRRVLDPRRRRPRYRRHNPRPTCGSCGSRSISRARSVASPTPSSANCAGARPSSPSSATPRPSTAWPQLPQRIPGRRRQRRPRAAAGCNSRIPRDVGTPAKAWTRALEITAQATRDPARILPQAVAEWADKYGDAVALVSDRERLNFRALEARMNQYSRWAQASRAAKPPPLRGATGPSISRSGSNSFRSERSLRSLALVYAHPRFATL